MRTKALLLTAALSAVGIATSTAEVYSVNAVGYVNKSLKTGWTLIANPLLAADNKLGTVIPNVPDGDGSYIYFFDTAAQAFLDPITFNFGAWDNADALFPPGVGAFINAAVDTTITFVGTVPTGDLSTPLVAGFQLVASQVPQAGLVTTLLNLTAVEDGDVVYQFDPNIQDYLPSATFNFGSWDAEPNVAVGESFWLQKASAGAWTRTFSVNP